MSLILRVVALVLWSLGLLVALTWLNVDPGGWEPAWTFLFGGLVCWGAAELVP